MPDQESTSAAPVRKRLTRQESQARTRALLLEVATAEFLAHGYTGTSLERIAELAGFSKGAVYGNFAGKEELCLAVLENHFFAQLQKFVGEFAAGGETIEDRLGVLERWLEMLLAEDDWQVLAVEFAVHTRRNPKIQQQLAERERMVRAAVTTLLSQQIQQLGVKPVLPPEQLGIVLVSVVGGITVQRLLDPTIPASLVTDAVRALFRAPKPEGGSS
jgi:AcrR family transcriptional regulator